jgi:signal transduction histidine kinase
MWQAIGSGKIWRGEICNRAKSGSLYWVETTIVPIRAADDAIVQYVAIRTDITELKRIEQVLRKQAADLAEANALAENQNIALAVRGRQLEAARQEAEIANRAKSAFLANMSHEIRTPMTAILGFAETLDDPILTAEARREHVGIIRSSGLHLLNVLNDILDLSKIEAGGMQVEKIDCEPLRIVGEVVDLMRNRASSKGLPLELSCISTIPPVISTDPTRLRQILINLIGNAVKFTERGSIHVDVGWQEAAGEVPSALRIDIADSGIGISDEQIFRIFQPFSQADASTTRRFGGTGLGLAISQRLAHLLGGQIDVSSKLGEGSVFTLRLYCPVESSSA